MSKLRFHLFAASRFWAKFICCAIIYPAAFPLHLFLCQSPAQARCKACQEKACFPSAVCTDAVWSPQTSQRNATLRRTIQLTLAQGLLGSNFQIRSLTQFHPRLSRLTLSASQATHSLVQELLDLQELLRGRVVRLELLLGQCTSCVCFCRTLVSKSSFRATNRTLNGSTLAIAFSVPSFTSSFQELGLFTTRFVGNCLPSSWATSLVWFTLLLSCLFLLYAWFPSEVLQVTGPW